MQETLHFDPARGALTPLRSKEEAHDYRYFPEPDLVPLLVTEEMLEAARARPAGGAADASVRARFERELGLSAAPRARARVPRRARRLLRAGARGGADGTAASTRSSSPTGFRSWSSGSARTRTRPSSKVAPESLATLATMVKAREVSRDAAREVLTLLVESGGDPRAIVEREGLGAISAEEDGPRRDRRPRRSPSDPAAAEQVRPGNMEAIGPLVGYVMRETKGRADGGRSRA